LTVRPLGVLAVVALLAALPLEAITLAFALFGSIAATVGLVFFRRAVKRLDASVADLAARLPDGR
jgi:uncharacterized protein involved in exopolysaccharide biosynthesis